MADSKTGEELAQVEADRNFVVGVAVTAAVVTASYYLVRRGIDRRVARQIRRHVRKEH